MDLQLQAIADAGIRPLERALYDRMVASGVFDGVEVELLHGVLVPMSPQGTPHSYVIRALKRLLRPLEDRAEVQIQLPFAASDLAEPEPDVSVVPVEDWLVDHPDRAWLVIEVSVTSQRVDRGTKSSLYASSRVEEYWVVDVPAGTVTVYRDAIDGGWQTMTTHTRGDTLTVRAFSDVQVPVSSILPPP